MWPVIGVVVISLAVIIPMMVGWRRTAAKAAEYKAGWEHEQELVAIQRVQIENLSSSPPDFDEQQRMLDHIIKRRRSLSEAVAQGNG